MTSTVTTAAPCRRRPVGARRGGYLVAAAVNALLVYTVYGWPGWRAVPFLTGDTPDVLRLVTASPLVTMAFNVLWVVHDPPRMVALGNLVAAVVSLAATVRVWRVFPFDFDTSFDWALIVRIVLVVAVAGTVVSLVVQLRRLVAGGR